jgi:hypothetical protein
MDSFSCAFCASLRLSKLNTTLSQSFFQPTEAMQRLTVDPEKQLVILK